MIEELRAAAGHIAGRAMGGAIIGAGVNGYEYSQTGAGFGGAFSMGESLVSGAAGGAIAGAVIGGLGARGVARAAGAKAAKAAAKQSAQAAKAGPRTRSIKPNLGRKADSIINADRAAANDYRRSLQTAPVNTQPAVSNIPHAQNNMNTAAQNTKKVAIKGRKRKR